MNAPILRALGFSGGYRGGLAGWMLGILQEGWLSQLGPHATAVLAFLAIAADGEGASFYLRETMAMKIGLDRRELDRCLERLIELELGALRPWSAGRADGVWQVLPVPRRGR